MTPVSLNLDTASRDEWLAARKLGASDAPTICGLNPYKTRFQLWLEKTGQGPGQEETEPMRWGKLLEPVIIAEFAERTGLKVERCSEMFESGIYNFMTCTPDAFVWENGERGLLQVKNRSSWSAKDYESGIGDDAHVQVMHEMAVTGCSFAYVAALIGGNKLVWHRVAREPKLIELIVQRESEFWTLVLDRTAPAMEAGDSDAVSTLYPTASESLHIILGTEKMELIRRYQEAKKASKLFDDEADKIQAQLKSDIGNAEGATVGHYRLTWKNQSRTSFDSKTFKKDQPDLYERYSTTTNFRKFDIKEIENNG